MKKQRLLTMRIKEIRASLSRKKKIGKPPGTLLHLGEMKEEKASLSYFEFSPNFYNEEHNVSLDESCKQLPDGHRRWININGLHETHLIEGLGKFFSIHSLVLEDILNTTHRPKFEDYGDYAFIVCKMLKLDEKTKELDVENLSIVILKNYIITFQEKAGDVFDPLRDRLSKGNKKIREGDSGYLAYCLIDTIVDNYFTVLEELGENIESLQAQATTSPDEHTAQNITALKHSMLIVRRTIWPLREVLLAIQRSDTELLPTKLDIYFRDVYDHVVHIIDTIETYREMLSSVLDMYLSSLNLRMNRVLNTLTIFATIFMPLTFIAGVYGMNFENMPELEWSWGYYGVLVLMGVVAGGMLLYFKRRHWILNPEDKKR